MGVAIKNFGADAKIEAEVKIQGNDYWETSLSETVSEKQIEFKSEAGKFLSIGKEFKGVIHSATISTSNGELRVLKESIMRNKGVKNIF